MYSIVFCLLLSCSRWFPPSLLCYLAIFYVVIPLISSLSLVATLWRPRGLSDLELSCHLELCFDLGSISSSSDVQLCLICVSDSHILCIPFYLLQSYDPRFNSQLHRGDFSGSGHTSDLEIGTPVPTLPCAWLIGLALGLVGLVSV